MVDCWTRTRCVATPPQSVEYFYGRISRQEADTHLLAAGNDRDGRFLLRWCINHANAYGIAVIYQRKYVLPSHTIPVLYIVIFSALEIND